jgi:hypothetical protein
MQKSICGFQEKEMDNKKKNDRTHTQTKNIYTVREREKWMLPRAKFRLVMAFGEFIESW